MINCIYPSNSASTAYQKGCRCDRCLSKMHEYQKTEKYKNYRILYETTQRKKQNKIQKENYIKNKLKYQKSDKGKAKRLEWRQSERGRAIRNAINGKRRSKMKCDVNLQENEEIVLMYQKCKDLTKITGIEHEVDHIIPITKGGLHHPSNLQILTGDENRKKGSKILN